MKDNCEGVGLPDESEDEAEVCPHCGERTLLPSKVNSPVLMCTECGFLQVKEDSG